MIKCTTRGLAEILDELRSLEATFALDKNDLGRSLMEITTQSILINMSMECDPDGIPWPPLSGSYDEFKQAIAPGAPMAVLHGHMKTHEQIAGTQMVTPDVATMEYGVDEKARTEAVKFTFGGIVTGTNQPQRPFYGITQFATQRIASALDQTFRNAF